MGNYWVVFCTMLITKDNDKKIILLLSMCTRIYYSIPMDFISGEKLWSIKLSK